jgi:diguanylate cyclase (GGDEF)-like protein
MFHLAWKTRSFRFWLGFSLSLAVMPLAVSAVLGHLLVSRGVMASFADVAARQRTQVAPAYRLRSALIEAIEPVDDFVVDGDPANPLAYRLARQQIESTYAELVKHLGDQPAIRTVLERSREDWTAADRAATELISVRSAAGDPQGAARMQRFHGLIGAAVDKMTAVSTDLEVVLAHDHDQALLFYERSDWLAGIAAGISLLAMIAGVVTIGRIVAASVDRLVEGAARFAAGDRDHRIDIQLPPELHSVANEFNRMIVRVHESESMLTDLAHRDRLTSLPNRRAFDDKLTEMFARMQRLSEPASLLMIDIDHFKRINDTHGHAAGDDVLRAVARVMAAEVRLVDSLFRIGGEEFAAILCGTGLDGAELTAERLRRAVAAEAITVTGKTAAVTVPVTISVGVVPTTRVSTPVTLVATADAALYRAKAEGRNRVVIAG